MKVLIRTMLAIIAAEILSICASTSMIPFALVILILQLLIMIGFIGWQNAAYRNERLQKMCSLVIKDKHGN